MSTGRLRRVLIVEDEKPVVRLLAQGLLGEPDDYEVITAASGEQAIEALAGQAFDLIITDLVLPGMTGLELLQWVRTSYPGTGVIVITGFGGDEVRERARQLGALDYIDKPFSFEEMRQSVRHAFDAAAELQEPSRTGACDSWAN